jgi:lambda family phage portal protein
MAAPVNIVDRLIGWINPRAGRERLLHRTLLEHAQTRAFEAANRSDGWRPRRAGASADADVAGDAKTIRHKARHLRDNIGIVSRGLQSRIDYAVGTGIVRKWTGPHATKLADLWAQFERQADADGMLSLSAMEGSAVHATDVDGEVLLRIRPRLPEDGLAVPVQLQMLEVDWIDDTRRDASRSGHVVINGVEYDQIGRRVGWWLYDQHPGSAGLGGLPARLDSRLVPDAMIIHLANVTRPGQRRGVSRLAPVINTVRDLHLLKDAELARRNLESRIGVVASGDVSSMADGVRVDGKEGAQSLGDLPSGGVLQLPPGLNLTTVAPNAAPGYLDTVKHETQLICAAGGWTYEAATGDMRMVNYSSARIRRLDFRREIERLQWQTIDPMLCQRIDAAFVAHAKLAGLIPPSASWTCEHTYPRWPHVDPVKDVAGELAEIAGGLSTISEGVRARGNDPLTVHAEGAEDYKRLKASGLLDLMMLLKHALVLHPDDEPAAGEGDT